MAVLALEHLPAQNGGPEATVFVTGLETPWAMDFAPDGRIFVTERPGRIRVIREGILSPEPWLTTESSAAPGRESGLLGLALDPTFAENGYVYVAESYHSDGQVYNRLLRLKDAAGWGVLDKILLDAIPGAANHDGGRVKFGPDGKLYWTVGDATNQDLAQDTASLNGKILRLNADGSVPNDNPFPGSFVYAYGLRNPQGLSWDAAGRLYSTDHGPSGVQGVGQDEINLIVAGKNYGWPVIRGAMTKNGMESPLVQSTIARIWAPGSCLIVKGGKWNGSLLFSGLRGETLYRMTINSRDPKKIAFFEELFVKKFGRLREVAQGPDGTIYVTTSNTDGRGYADEQGDKILIVKP